MMIDCKLEVVELSMNCVVFRTTYLEK